MELINIANYENNNKFFLFTTNSNKNFQKKMYKFRKEKKFYKFFNFFMSFFLFLSDTTDYKNREQ
jgi:hypothetical protein